MVFHKNYSIGLIWLVFSLLVLLVACSSNNTLLKPTPPAHLVSTLVPGNGGGTGRIALACAPDPAQHKPDICVSNLDGSGLRRLTSGPGPNVSPAWAPDGKRLVFRAADAHIFEASDIWIMNADGSQQSNLTKDQQSNWGATWTPDGKHILFNSAVNGWRK
jgi:dipeptidyl aminopeptidase/acylaminoacyl peptidase